MSGQLQVDYEGLYALHDRLKSIAEGFVQVDDRGDFDEATFGDRRVVDALEEFAKNWSDGRGRIYDSVNSLKDAVWQTAHEYEQVEKDTAKAMGGGEAGSGGGGGSNGAAGAGTAAGAAVGAVGAAVSGGGGGASASPSTPTAPGSAPSPSPSPAGLAPSGPASDGMPITALPAPAPVLGRPDTTPGGPSDPTRSMLTRQSTELRRMSDELRERGAQLPPGPEHDRLLREADEMQLESNRLEDLAQQSGDGHLVACDPAAGRFVQWDGSPQPDRAVVVVGRPGGASTFLDDTAANGAAVKETLAAGGKSDTAVVSWQDYAQSDGGPPTPEQAVPQGAANLNAFVGGLRDQGIPADRISVMGAGTGADVINHAVAHGLPAGTVVTPERLGVDPRSLVPAGPPPAAPEPAGISSGLPITTPPSEAAVPTGAVPSATVTDAPASHGSGGNSSMMGMMMLGSMGQSLFFRGGNLKSAVDQATGDQPPTERLSTW